MKEAHKEGDNKTAKGDASWTLKDWPPSMAAPQTPCSEPQFGIRWFILTFGLLVLKQ
jgi:hypothetical protein